MNTLAPTWRFDDGMTLLTEGDQVMARLSLSPASLAQRHWPDGRPTPLGLERAIEEIEAAIEQSELRRAKTGTVITEAWRQLLPAPLPQRPLLGREDIEKAFSDLVSNRHGPAPSGPSHSQHSTGAAALLLLRELMHHLDMPSVGVTTAP